MIICDNCSTEISPNWVHCLNKGECPACGASIYDDSSKELVDELRKAFEEMPNNPAGLAGWLLSNYHLTKIGDAQPVEFYGQKRNKFANSNDDETEYHGQGFMQRAGLNAREQEKNNKLASIAQQLREAQDHMYGNGNSEIEEDMINEEVQPRTPEEMAFVQNAMPFGNAKLSGMGPSLTKAGVNVSSGELNLISEFAEQAAEKASKIHPAVEKERLKRLARQEQNAKADDSGRPSFKR